MHEIAAIQLALALLLDWVVGEYPRVLHPVVWMGAAATLLLKLRPKAGWWRQFVFGDFVVLVIGGLTAGCTFLALWLTGDNALWQIAVGAILLKSSFALSELGRAAQRVARPLEAGNLAEARMALRSLCSRDPTELNPQELVAGTVESLAENASDSFVAPLFYFLLFGVPGALVYRAINTLDAMIGYRGDYEALGKTAARLDDVVNWIPARLTAMFLLLVGWLSGKKVTEGWRILRRDGGKTPSPNGGRPMAAMAGLLGVQLEKKGIYVLGEPQCELTPRTIDEAWTLTLRASFLVLTAMMAVFAGLYAAES